MKKVFCRKPEATGCAACIYYEGDYPVAAERMLSCATCIAHEDRDPMCGDTKCPPTGDLCVKLLVVMTPKTIAAARLRGRKI